jgi:drug/metabolite transporter (DMT)-like permease
VQWLTFMAAAGSYAVLCVAFAMSVNYITVSDATILTNSQSILLVAVKMCAGQNVLFLEAAGVVVAFMGGILCAQESAEGETSPANGWWSVWGDVLGLVSSMGGIGYIVLGKSLRAHMPVIVFMVLNMLTASFIIL